MEKFSLEEWLPKFSLDSKDGSDPSFLGPDHICLAELLRREVGVYSSPATLDPVESDVFVLGYGEGPGRCITKIGGLPYMRKDCPWPISKETGRPLSFICQFRFSESVDIVGELPGDVLLVFCYKLGYPEWYFMWCKLGIDERDLRSE